MNNLFSCDNCGSVTLSQDEMLRQMSNPDAVWKCPTCRHQIWPDDEKSPAINWILVEAVPYEGSDPTLYGASFDLWKFYSPAAAARIRETGHRNFNAWMQQDDDLWPATAVDGCQFHRLDGDYIVCKAISV